MCADRYFVNYIGYYGKMRHIQSILRLTMYYKIYNNISAFPSNYLPRNNSVRTYYVPNANT